MGDDRKKGWATFLIGLVLGLPGPRAWLLADTTGREEAQQFAAEMAEEGLRFVAPNEANDATPELRALLGLWRESEVRKAMKTSRQWLPELPEVLTQHATECDAICDAFRAAMQKPRTQFSAQTHTDLPYWEVTGIAELAMSRALLRAAENPAGGDEDLLAVRRLTEALLQERNLMERMMGLSLLSRWHEVGLWPRLERASDPVAVLRKLGAGPVHGTLRDALRHELAAGVLNGGTAQMQRQFGTLAHGGLQDLFLGTGAYQVQRELTRLRNAAAILKLPYPKALRVLAREGQTRRGLFGATQPGNWLAQAMLGQELEAARLQELTAAGAQLLATWRSAGRRPAALSQDAPRDPATDQPFELLTSDEASLDLRAPQIPSSGRLQAKTWSLRLR